MVCRCTAKQRTIKQWLDFRKKAHPVALGDESSKLKALRSMKKECLSRVAVSAYGLFAGAHTHTETWIKCLVARIAFLLSFYASKVISLPSI